MFQHHPKLFLSEVCQWSHSVLGNAKAVSALIEQKARRRPNLQSYDFAQLYMYSVYSLTAANKRTSLNSFSDSFVCFCDPYGSPLH